MYNDARRRLLLEPYASLDDLADNEDLDLQISVYTGFQFMVDSLAEKERLEGLVFGIVPYHIFVVLWCRDDCSAMKCISGK